METKRTAKDIFSGVRAKWMPLYEQLKEMAESELGAFEERITTQAVIWTHTSSFAEIRAKKDCMVIGFASDILHEEWNADKVTQTSKNRIAHYFEVTDDTLFPILIERIVQAYALTKTSRPVVRAAGKEQEYNTIDAYIALFPEDMQAILKEIRKTIQEAAPDATEKISWKMPTFWQGENIVHFAMAKNHIGFYPGDSGVTAFKEQLKEYKTSKGAIQFPLSRPIPYELITEITKYRVKESLERKKE